ncbi:MAG: hypothetical protein QNK04_03740 [Myxococcota bacterium]|nr:hypothetical protein [Myxococcota bacterium]
MIRAIFAGVIAVALAAPGVAAARDAEDVAMERKVRRLGLSIGEAFACTDTKEREVFKEEAHHLFDLILQDVGTDLGFTYATALGAGSREPKAGLDCPALLKRWEEIREDYELKGED